MTIGNQNMEVKPRKGRNCCSCQLHFWYVTREESRAVMEDKAWSLPNLGMERKAELESGNQLAHQSWRHSRLQGPQSLPGSTNSSFHVCSSSAQALRRSATVTRGRRYPGHHYQMFPVDIPKDAALNFPWASLAVEGTGQSA